jgi:hypothetical protein
MTPNVTLLELVSAVAEHARSEVETIATVVWMVNSGCVRLCGNFRGARFDRLHYRQGVDVPVDES